MQVVYINLRRSVQRAKLPGEADEKEGFDYPEAKEQVKGDEVEE